MAEAFPLPVPYGWFFVSYSDELEAGQVKALHYFGREWVLFRTEEGVACMMDAYCPHLGAHLGHGGHVEGELLRCPFHGWAFAADGRCSDVPYAKRIPPRVDAVNAVPAVSVVERNQVIWAWYHPVDEAPSFEVDAHPELDDPEWEALRRYQWRFRSNPQEIAENGVDPAHFRYVHKMDAVPEGDTLYEGVMRRSSVEGPRTAEDPNGDTRTYTSRVVTVQNGAGQKWTRISGLTEILLMVLVTPVDSQEVELRFAFTRRREAPGSFEEALGIQAIESTASGVEDDIEIWKRKRYVAQPMLCDGDGPIPEFRRYFSNFYAGPDAPAAQGAGHA